MLHAYTKKNRMVFLIKRVRYTLRQSAVLTLTLLNGVKYRTTGVAYTLAARSFLKWKKEPLNSICLY